MKICSYKDCYTQKLTFSSIAFFTLPKDSRRAKWIKNSGNRDLDNLSPSKLRYFCERHFEKKDIRVQFNRKLLRSGAIPQAYMEMATKEEYIDVDDTVHTVGTNDNVIVMASKEEFIGVDDTSNTIGSKDNVIRKDDTVSAATTASDDEDEIQFNVCFSYESESPTVDVDGDETHAALEEESALAINIDNDKAGIDYESPEYEQNIHASPKDEITDERPSTKYRLSGAGRRRLKALLIKGLDYGKAREMARKLSEPSKQELSRKRLRSDDSTLKDSGPKRMLVNTNAATSKNPALVYTSKPIKAVTLGGTEVKMDTPILLRDIVSIVKMGIIPKGYPDTVFTTDQLRAIQKALLIEILRQCKGSTKPNFTGCTLRAGWMAFNCGDKSTADWLRQIVPKLVPWEGAQLNVMPEEEILRPLLYVGCFPLLLGVKVEDILKMVEGQNTDLNTSDWTLLNCVRRGYVVELTMSMNAISANKLKQRNDTVAFGFNRVQLRTKEQRTAPTATVMVTTVASKTASEAVALKTAPAVEVICCSKEPLCLPQDQLAATGPEKSKQTPRVQTDPAVAVKLSPPLCDGPSGAVQLRSRNGNKIVVRGGRAGK